MKRIVTIRLDDELAQMLGRVCRRSKHKRSEMVRDALRRQLSLLLFGRLRRKAMPFARAHGYLTDEDVLMGVS